MDYTNHQLETLNTDREDGRLGRPSFRAAVYTRGDTPDSPSEAETQAAELNQFAEQLGWPVVHEYRDHDNGNNVDRVEFQRMLADAAQHRFDVVLFRSLDRFTPKGALEALKYLLELSDFGVAYRSLTEPCLDSAGAFKDIVMAVVTTIAKQERVRIAERNRAGSRRAREQGKHSGRPMGRPRAVFSRDLAMELRKSGLSWRQVASRLSVGITTVKRACRDAKTECQNSGERDLQQTSAENELLPAIILPLPRPGPAKGSA